MQGVGSNTGAGGPIFVVGPSRSGTALMRSCLNNHSHVHLAGETHYFDDLRPRLDVDGDDIVQGRTQQLCEDYFLALTDRPYGHAGQASRSQLPRPLLRERAAALGSSPNAYFEAFCRLSAEAAGKERWGEKTPRHVFRIQDILATFPNARIVCMVRDPRAVAASYRSWWRTDNIGDPVDEADSEALIAEAERAHRSYHPVIASVMWRSAIGAASTAYRSFGSKSVYIQRYEDLVEEPRAALHDLAAWLSIPYEDAMLNVPMHNSSFAAFESTAGVRRDGLERWRNTLTAGEVSVVQRLCEQLLVQYGYAPVPVHATKRQVAKTWYTLPSAIARATISNRHRMASLPDYAWRRVRASFASQ